MSIPVKKQHVTLAGKFKLGWNQYKNVTFKKTQPLQRVRPRSDGFANLLIRRLRNPILFRLNPMILTSTLFADFIPLGMARLLASEFFQFFIFSFSRFRILTLFCNSVTNSWSEFVDIERESDFISPFAGNVKFANGNFPYFSWFWVKIRFSVYMNLLIQH